MSGVFIAWLLVANRVPLLERVAFERNIGAGGLLIVLALVPVLRFLRYPRRLLLSGFVATAVFSFVYRLLCLFFAALPDRMGAFHLFILGNMVYAIVATVAWIGTLIWAVRGHNEQHSGHHLS